MVSLFQGCVGYSTLLFLYKLFSQLINFSKNHCQNLGRDCIENVPQLTENIYFNNPETFTLGTLFIYSFFSLSVFNIEVCLSFITFSSDF